MNTAYEASGVRMTETISARTPNYPVTESPSVATPQAARNGLGFSFSDALLLNEETKRIGAARHSRFWIMEVRTNPDQGCRTFTFVPEPQASTSPRTVAVVGLTRPRPGRGLHLPPCGATAACLAHNQEVAGSTPARATNFRQIAIRAAGGQCTPSAIGGMKLPVTVGLCARAPRCTAPTRSIDRLPESFSPVFTVFTGGTAIPESESKLDTISSYHATAPARPSGEGASILAGGAVLNRPVHGSCFKPSINEPANTAYERL